MVSFIDHLFLLKFYSMGSKTTPNRKLKDTVYIPTPRQSVMTSVDPAPVSLQDKIAELCPISFQVQIPETVITKPGIAVSLKKVKTFFHVFVMGHDLVSLTANQSAMVEICGQMNVRYVGIIVSEKKKLYARFRRITV